MSEFSGVRIEGGLLGPDILEKLLAGDLPGQKPEDFGFNSKRGPVEEIAAVFADCRKYWEAFQSRLQRLPESDLATSITRDAWAIPFFSLLGIEVRYQPRACEVDGMNFPISHRMGEAEDAPPVHIVGARQELGRVPASGRPRLAPHSLLQEYLNRSEHLWGIVTNGLTLRLLRDSTYVRRQAYVEFDLKQILEEQRFNDFAILFRLLHRSRLPQTAELAGDCLLEKYYQQALEQGGRVRERLREGVEECIRLLANGFLAHPKNQRLRARLLSDPRELYRQLLRLVYRFLFLLVSEERGLMSSAALYREHYSVTRLRRFLDRQSAQDEHEDLWCSLRVLWRVLSQEELAELLGAAPLNGELFAPLELDECSLSNRDLLQAFSHLAYYRENPTSPLRRVNYAALDVEELGSVYESLLDYQPQIVTGQGAPRFELSYGSERKSTGSYYTPPELVAELIRSALEPVIEERLKAARPPEEKEQAILSIRVCDPACGSGHFLLAAARRLGKELAKIRTGEEEPAPERVREAIRDVVAHCIYGVDKNPLAVELCRVALWLEAHCAGKPLTFLDHHIKCGDSLVGVLDLAILEKGIPDEAFTPVSADSKEAARSLKQRNRTECQSLQTGQLSLAFDTDQVVAELSQERQKLEAIPDNSPAEVSRKQQLYSRYCQDPQHQKLVEACNLWTAAFFQPLIPDFSRAITTQAVADRLQERTPSQALATAQALAVENRFFHWPLEFPEVFESGGFDVILGNPPWERIKLQEEEFFASRNTAIARAPNAAARKRLIADLPKTNPALWHDYQRALHGAESTSRFLRGSGQYPLTGRGDINTYSVFAERVRSLLNIRGRAGIIVPTGIATDATNQFFFADLVEQGQLASLFDFENREALFPGVHRSYKFCLLTLTGSRTQTDATTFTFFATHADHLRDPRRVFTLTADDIARINPNTRTLPVFRTRQDADLTRAIYQRVPVLVNERTGENPWDVRFMAMFHMSNDSHLFRTRAELEQQGYRLVGNRLIKDGSIYLPMYEGRLGFQFNHRYATQPSGNLQVVSLSQLQEACFLVEPQFFVDQNDFKTRMGRLRLSCVTGLLGYRRISNNTNERTVVASIIPWGPASYGWILSLGPDAAGLSLLCATYNSLVFDYLLRQSLSQPSIPQSTFEQVAALPPTAYTSADLAFIVPRALELTYTASDLKPFADDVWNEADDGLRAAIHAAWDANRIAVGRHEWRLPSWISAYPEIETNPQKGIPFPPFTWNEERRAVLRAELDAYYARLYGLTRKQLRYILDPADLTERELEDILDPREEVADPLDPAGYATRAAASTFPGETFRVLKEKEIRQYGEYRTRRLVLEAWEKLAQHSIKA
ncbi:Eco57I restriction-modification methylase domain-containing protein [Thermostichus sp. OS-CIW-30]